MGESNHFDSTAAELYSTYTQAFLELEAARRTLPPPSEIISGLIETFEEKVNTACVDMHTRQNLLNTLAEMRNIAMGERVRNQDMHVAGAELIVATELFVVGLVYDNKKDEWYKEALKEDRARTRAKSRVK